MKFSHVAVTLDRVAATRARTAKIAALADALRAADPDEIAPLVGMLSGSLRQGRVGAGWRTLARYLDLPEPAHTSAGPGPAGAEPGHLAAAEPATTAAENALTVADVDTALTALTQVAAGAGSQARRAEVLTRLFERATRPERELLVKMLTGELRTGALGALVLDGVAQAAQLPVADVRRAAMLTGDAGETATMALTDPDALAQVGLVVGRPVLPMLASTAATVTDALAITGRASVEYKLDGARIQVHRRGDQVTIATRTLGDVTARLPEIVADTLTLPCQDVILDGETLLLGEDGAPRPFQETMSRFGSGVAHDELDPAQTEGGVRQRLLRPWYFDVLHVDGRDLVDEPLSVRRAELARIVGDRLIPGLVTDDPAEAERVAADALAAGHEGVLVKAVESTYAAGRRGKQWVKVKPVRTADLVVLAAEWGSGRRQGWLSNLHLGARDPQTGELVMVGKTFKGLTDELLAWQTEQFLAIETGRRGHIVHVEPRLVVEIAYDGVQASRRYPGGVALRFARVKGYRADKTPAEADTIDLLRSQVIA